jgi:hypothetical protein
MFDAPLFSHEIRRKPTQKYFKAHAKRDTDLFLTRPLS